MFSGQIVQSVLTHNQSSELAEWRNWLSGIIMSHSLLWRHIVLLTVGFYSSNHRVLYTIGISMTRRFQKSVSPSVRPSVRLSVCLSVRLSVCPFVALTKKAYSSIIDSRKIICISDERVWHPLQENEAIFSKILERIFEKLRICTKMPAPPSLLTVE